MLQTTLENKNLQQSPGRFLRSVKIDSEYKDDGRLVKASDRDRTGSWGCGEGEDQRKTLVSLNLSGHIRRIRAGLFWKNRLKDTPGLGGGYRELNHEVET